LTCNPHEQVQQSTHRPLDSRGELCGRQPGRLEDQPLKDKESGHPADFAFALYARQAR
jgi:hypothetical protein